MTHDEYHKLGKALLEQAVSMKGDWRELERRIMPRMSDEAGGCGLRKSTKKEACSTASEAMHTLAASHYNYITPNGMGWFKFKPTDKTENETYKNWYANATEVALQELAKSNFYAEVQECYLSRVLYGTALMLCEVKRGGGLLFRNIPVGSFGIAENDEGIVDTVCRKFEYTAQQAVARWGKPLPSGGYDISHLPQRVQQAYEKPGSRISDKFEFMHLVTPRRAYTQGNSSQYVKPTERRYASVYMFEGESDQILEEGGYDEFPYLATRFLKKPGSVWGYAPARMCWSSILSLLELDNNLDMLGTLAVLPRMLTLADEVGEIDYRPGGQTVVSDLAANSNMPREWGTQGRMTEALERREQLKREIESAFSIPFLQAVTSVDRTMTATEVQARQEERVLSISPTFALFSADFEPMLYRIFCTLFRQGFFNTNKHMPPPFAVKAQAGQEAFDVPVPEVLYLGRISQAVEKSYRAGAESLLQLTAEFVHATGQTDVMDSVDYGMLFAQVAETVGAPAGCIRSQAEVQQIRAQRQQLQMAQAQMEMAMNGARAAKDMTAAA